MNADLAAQIRSHRPTGAKAYYLTDFDHRYPASGGFALEPFSAPFGLPAGEYRLYFLSDVQNGQSVAPSNPANQSPSIRITAEASVALAPGKPQSGDKSGDKPVKSVQPDPLVMDPEHLRHRVEFEAIRMADQTVKNKQLLPRAGLRTREIGEGFVLNRAWRQETEQLVRMLGQTHRQTLEQSRQTLLQAKEAAQMLIDAGKALPVPPPDHMTPFLGLMGQVVGMIGGALSGRSRKPGSKGEEILEALVGTDEGEDGEDSQSPTRQMMRRLQEELALVKKKVEAKQRAAAKKAAAKGASKAKKAAKTKKQNQKVKKKSTKSESDPKSKTKRTPARKTVKTPTKRSDSPARKKSERGVKTTKRLPAKGAK